MPHGTVSLLALAFAAAIGLALGTLGGGGSVLTVPVLVYLLGYDPKVAVPMSLGVVGAASLVSAIGHWRAGRADARIAVAFGIVTMVGSYAGARLAIFVPGGVQLAILAIVMVTAAVLMLRPKPPAPRATRERTDPMAATRPMSPLRHAARLAPVGVALGVLTGLVGIGGGFLIVPALVLWGGVEMPTAVGTSLIVITLNCITGLAGYVGRVAVPWSEAVLFTLVAVAGAAAGTALVGGVPPQRLRRIFAVFLLGVGSFVLFRNRHALSDSRIHPDAGRGPASPADSSPGPSRP